MTNMVTQRKYARREVERRWLVDLGGIVGWQELPSRRIDDLYIEGTRLRLRKVTFPGGSAQFKLGCKEQDEGSPHPWLTNIYLDAAEYEALNGLNGLRVTKTRYSLEGGALDVPDQSDRPVIFEREFESEALAEMYEPPTFTREEVTARGTLSDALSAAPSGSARLVCQFTPVEGQSQCRVSLRDAKEPPFESSIARTGGELGS